MSADKEHIDIPEFIHEYLSNPEKIGLENRVTDWLKTAKNKRKFIELYDIWQSSKLICNQELYEPDGAWKELKRSIPLHHRKKVSGFPKMTKRTIQILAIAASVIILISCLYFLGTTISNTGQRPLQYTEYSVPYSSMSKVILPDSSSVWINAGSTLKYNSDFGYKNRDVFLSGEAFFNVTPDSKLPFEVKLQKISFRAIGTSFNIKAYKEDQFIEAIVEEGKIQLKGLNQKKRKSNAPIYLDAKQMLIIKEKSISGEKNVNKNQVASKPEKHNFNLPVKTEITYQIVSNVNTEIPTSWKEDEWIIDHERFEDFAVMLQRRYDVHIIFDDESLKDFTFSGIIKNETLEQMLKAIYLTTPIQYKIEGKTITLSRNRRFKEN